MITKTITVLGALGGQGGSVVNSFVKDGSFKIRGVTSHIDSEEAKALQHKKNVDILAGDVKKPESLLPAFSGADTAFIVVNFWDPEIMIQEGELTKEIMGVAKKAGVKHIIFSSLANVAKASSGKISVPHFTLKAQAYDYLSTLGFESVTAVEPAAYYSNWFTFFQPTEEKDGTLVWTWPGKDTPVSQFDVASGTGPAVLEAAKNPERYNGKHILLEADLLTPGQIVEKISHKLGKPGRVEFADPEEFSKRFPGAHELAEMVKWFNEYSYYGPETDERKHGSGKAIGGLISFDEWMESGEYKKYI